MKSQNSRHPNAGTPAFSGILQILLLSGALFLFPERSPGESHDLKPWQQDRIQALAKKTAWRRLLHYRPSLSGTESLIQSDDFFLHPEGRSNPEAELAETLAQLLADDGNDEQAVQCRFPARYEWLKRQLSLDENQLPKRDCKALNDWLENLDVHGITLVFPVAYLNNPASMFGHSFLKLDQGRLEKGSDLLAWTVNYAAVTEKERGLSFAVKGLFGGYHGKFSLAPYHVLLKEYADIDNRDLWEYRLDFSTAQIRRLLLHLWELLPAGFDYYFINKNCSYQLLALIEAARPELELTAKFNFDAIPADTVRALIHETDVLKDTRFRPALATRLQANAARFDERARQLAKALVQEKTKPDDKALTKLPESQKARILELAFDYLSYLNAKRIKAGENINGKLAYDLLAARSRLPLKLPPAKIPVPAKRPDEGHAGNRTSLAYGYDGDAHYLETVSRWSYHDHYDPQQGFVKGAAVEFFKPAIRYYPGLHKFHLESFELLGINSMPQYDDFLRSFSWQVFAGAKRMRFADGQRRLLGELKMGAGVSHYPSTNSLLSLSAVASVMIHPHFKQYTALGAGAEMLFQYDVTPSWRIGIEAGGIQYFQGISQTAYHYRLRQRFSLSASHALLVDFGRLREFGSPEFNAQLALRFYF